MANYNRIILMGNLTRGPEMRQTQGGLSVMNSAVAVNEVGKDGKQSAIFVDIAAFGKVAENISRFFKKGEPILVEGRLRQEQWTDRQTGAARSKLSVLVERFEFVRGKSDAGAETPKAHQEPTQDEEFENVDF